DRPIILGEAGWTTVNNGSCVDCGGASLGVSAATQADNLVKALEVASQWSYVHRLVVYELAVHGPAESSSASYHFRVLRRDLSGKPAADALAQQIAAWRQTSNTAI